MEIEESNEPIAELLCFSLLGRQMKFFRHSFEFEGKAMAPHTQKKSGNFAL